MNYNVYYYFLCIQSQETLSSYGVFEGNNEDHAKQLADTWLRERHGDGHYKIWDIIPAAGFVDEDDYSTGF